MFKIYLLFLDASRLVSFVFKLGLLQHDKLDSVLKTWNTDGYFLECLVWLVLYSYDLGATPKMNREKVLEIKLNLVKYVCDAVVAVI